MWTIVCIRYNLKKTFSASIPENFGINPKNDFANKELCGIFVQVKFPSSVKPGQIVFVHFPPFSIQLLSIKTLYSMQFIKTMFEWKTLSSSWLIVWRCIPKIRKQYNKGNTKWIRMTKWNFKKRCNRKWVCCFSYF